MMNQATMHLNDVTVGDIVEAVLAMRYLDTPCVDHHGYAFHIEQAFNYLPQLFEHIEHLGCWENSRLTAKLII